MDDGGEFHEFSAHYLLAILLLFLLVIESSVVKQELVVLVILHQQLLLQLVVGVHEVLESHEEKGVHEYIGKGFQIRE